MNVVIATCFKSNEERVGFIKETFKQRGDKVTVITTDFDHINHKKRIDKNNEYLYLNTKEYKKNISISRLLSHKQFAKDLFERIKEIKPDLIWLIAPANSLIEQAKNYKETHNTKLIIDIIDMWPESLPVSINKNNSIFNIWRNKRSKNLSCADQLVCECDYYKEILSKEFNGEIHTLRWCKDKSINKLDLDLPKDKLSLCYLGSINNIINIDSMCSLIKKTNKEVVLNIIGSGENKDQLIDKLKDLCEIVDYGEQRDETKKAEILKCCHAGLNLYQDGLYIGLTVKSIDYLAYGLPIINNIKGDTWSLIEKYNVGFNVNDTSTLISEEIVNMRLNNKHIHNLYNEQFTKEVFINKCNQIIDEVLR